MKITIETLVNSDLETVWAAWNDPAAIKQWNAASDDWHTPQASVDLREGGKFTSRMEAKDGSAGFDFEGTYTRVEPNKLIEFVNHFTDKDRTRLDPAQIGMPPGIPKEVPHVITFKELDGDRTAVTVTEYGYTVEQARDISKMGMEQCLDKMAMIFAEP